MSRKIVINACFGGFNLSEKAIEMYCKLSGTEKDNFFKWRISRDDANLVKVVEDLGEEANSRYSELKIVEIPEDVTWEIDDYDGLEKVLDSNRVWR